ncbi:MAG: 50S ribosomal protein L18 [Gammaproteobacteria bacterium]|nr:50S ribosomal protein L18 [Gammaproteobacteria bacterium]
MKIKNPKWAARKRRSKKMRARIQMQQISCLCVFRSARHIYAQIRVNGKIVAGTSTVQKAIKNGLKNTGNITAAVEVGKAIAEKAKALNIMKITFDRSGYAYHGRIKALADAAREQGLQF